MSEDLLTRIAALEDRVLLLESNLFKKGRLARCVRDVVTKWPDAHPFTAKLIEKAVFEFFPELKQDTRIHSVPALLQSMEKAKLILCIEQGMGSRGNIFVRRMKAPLGTGKQGKRAFGKRHSYESGFRGVIRMALASEDLPEPFSLEDLRKWVAVHAPSAEVPQGTWSAQLYKLSQQGEIIIRRKHHYANGIRYCRGQRRVIPTGEEANELEESYKEFRESLKIEVPEMKSALERSGLEVDSEEQSEKDYEETQTH